MPSPRRIPIIAAVAGLVLAAAAGAATPGPAAYRSQLNALCRSYTPSLRKANADLVKTEKTKNDRAIDIALDTLIKLDLAQDAKIEGTPVPTALRTQMTPILSTLRVIDGHARSAIAKAVSGDGVGMAAELDKIGPLAKTLNKRLDAAGLRDCGSNQS